MGFSKWWMPLTVTESRFSLSLMRYSVCVSSLPSPLPLLYTPPASLTKLISEFSLVEPCALGPQLLLTGTGILHGDRWLGVGVGGRTGRGYAEIW